MKGVIKQYLPQLIYGANDGIVTTLAIVAGVVGANLSAQVILILGFANLLADGVSMGASAVLAERSKRDMPSLVQAAPIGIATFIGFLIAGLAPLVAYIVPIAAESRFTVAVALAGVALFAAGAGRAAVTQRSWLWAGTEMLAIGAAAGTIAYVVGILGAYLTGNG